MSHITHYTPKVVLISLTTIYYRTILGNYLSTGIINTDLPYTPHDLVTIHEMKFDNCATLIYGVTESCFNIVREMLCRSETMFIIVIEKADSNREYSDFLIKQAKDLIEIIKAYTSKKSKFLILFTYMDIIYYESRCDDLQPHHCMTINLTYNVDLNNFKEYIINNLPRYEKPVKFNILVNNFNINPKFTISIQQMENIKKLIPSYETIDDALSTSGLIIQATKDLIVIKPTLLFEYINKFVATHRYDIIDHKYNCEDIKRQLNDVSHGKYLIKILTNNYISFCIDDNIYIPCNARTRVDTSYRLADKFLRMELTFTNQYLVNFHSLVCRLYNITNGNVRLYKNCVIFQNRDNSMDYIVIGNKINGEFDTYRLFVEYLYTGRGFNEVLDALRKEIVTNDNSIKLTDIEIKCMCKEGTKWSKSNIKRSILKNRPLVCEGCDQEQPPIDDMNSSFYFLPPTPSLPISEHK